MRYTLIFIAILLMQGCDSSLEFRNSKVSEAKSELLYTVSTNTPQIFAMQQAAKVKGIEAIKELDIEEMSAGDASVLYLKLVWAEPFVDLSNHLRGCQESDCVLNRKEYLSWVRTQIDECPSATGDDKVLCDVLSLVEDEIFRA